jgi:hypothetical protein
MCQSGRCRESHCGIHEAADGTLRRKSVRSTSMPCRRPARTGLPPGAPERHGVSCTAALKRTGAGKRAAGGFEMRIPQIPRMGSFAARLPAHRHIGAAQCCHKAGRIVVTRSADSLHRRDDGAQALGLSTGTLKIKASKKPFLLVAELLIDFLS